MCSNEATKDEVELKHSSVLRPFYLLKLASESIYKMWHNLLCLSRRFRVSPDVQRLIRVGEPPLSSWFQATARGELWHLPKLDQKTATITAKDGYWHRKFENNCTHMTLPFCWKNKYLSQTFFCVLLFFLVFQGASNRHVQTHESAGWPEDHGRNEESDQLWCVAAGQLLRQDTGELQAIGINTFSNLWQ